jgi:flagellar assembly factor FliW
MEILTRDYGTVEINESSIIRFENGIIGFEDYHNYVLLDCAGEGEQSPFRCLQSTDDSDLAFILLDPFIVRPDYEVEIDNESAVSLSVEENADAAIFAIAVVPEDIKLMSINLKAPVIINARVNRGIQYIIDNSEYGVRHYLADEVERENGIRMCKDQTAV